MAAYVSARDVPAAEHRFYFGMAVAIAAIVFAGFARSFFLRPLFADFAAHQTPQEAWLYVHGALFTAWIMIFLAQTSLISNGNLAIYRKLGLAAVVLIPVMVVSVVGGVLIALRRPTGFFGLPVAAAPGFAASPLLQTVLFGLLAGLGIAMRGRPQAHKRLMLLPTMTMLEPSIARVPIDFIANGPALLPFALSALFLLPLAVWDLMSRGRLHAATCWGGLAFILTGLIRSPISQAPAWTGAMHWAAALLG